MNVDPQAEVHPAGPRRRGFEALPRLAGTIAVACVLLVEAGLYADSQLDALHGNFALRDAVRSGARPGLGFEPLVVFENLRALQPLIPPEARVLVVTAAIFPVAYDFHLLPRTMHVLVALDELSAHAAQLPAPAARQVHDWVALMEEHGQRLDADSLRERMEQADCLVTVLLEPDALPMPANAPPLHRIGQVGVTAAYRLGAPR